MSTAAHLRVELLDGSHRFFPIGPTVPWRINSTSRELIVGHGVPRTHVPLDNVAYYTIEAAQP